MALPIFKPLEDFKDYDVSSRVIRDYGSIRPKNEITLFPHDLDFLDLAVGSATFPQTALVVNSGIEDLIIHSIEVTGPFELIGEIPTKITEGHMEYVKVRYKPVCAGEHTGAMIVTSNSADGTSYVMLKGKGI